MRAEPALDAVTIEILWTRIVSIVDEAAKVIARTMPEDDPKTLSVEESERVAAYIHDHQTHPQSSRGNLYSLPFGVLVNPTVKQDAHRCDRGEPEPRPRKGADHFLKLCRGRRRPAG